MTNNVFTLQTKFGPVRVATTEERIRIFTPYETHYPEKGKTEVRPLILRNIPHKVDASFDFKDGKWVWDWHSEIRRVDTPYKIPEATTGKCYSQIRDEIEGLLQKISDKMILEGKIYSRQYALLRNHKEILTLRKEIEDKEEQINEDIEKIWKLKLERAR